MLGGDNIELPTILFQVKGEKICKKLDTHPSLFQKDFHGKLRLQKLATYSDDKLKEKLRK